MLAQGGIQKISGTQSVQRLTEVIVKLRSGCAGAGGDKTQIAQRLRPVATKGGRSTPMYSLRPCRVVVSRRPCLRLLVAELAGLVPIRPYSFDDA